jgi:hypothetical protein
VLEARDVGLAESQLVLAALAALRHTKSQQIETGATGLEPATSGVTDPYRLTGAAG